MKALQSVVLLILFSFSLCQEEKRKALFSPANPEIESTSKQENVQALHEKIADLENKFETFKTTQEILFFKLENVLLNSALSQEDKTGLVSSFRTRSIEDDVQQNKADITELRVTDGRHDMLISQGMLNTNYINNTIIPDLEYRVEVKIDELKEADAFIDATRPPVGSIIAWLPAYSAKAEPPQGWKRCDGSVIETGPLAGKATPDLNSSKRFLRGSSDETAGTLEEDSVQEHLHADPGHSHADHGHTHVDNGHSHYEDSDHFPIFVGSDEAHAEDLFCSRQYNSGCGGWYVKFNDWTTEAARANIAAAKASIQTSTTGMGGMASGRVGEETRPKNMNVVYIMRIF